MTSWGPCTGTSLAQGIGLHPRAKKIAQERGSSQITGPGGRLSFLRTSRMARLRPRGLGFAVAFYTWASRGETLVSTLAAQTGPPRSTRKGRSRGPCIHLAYGRSTCAELASRVDTKVSHDDTVSWTESRWRGCGRPSGPLRRSCRHVIPGSVGAVVAAALPREDDRDRRAGVDHFAMAMAMATSQPPKRRCFVGSTARTSELGRVFGAHPRGEFRTSGAAVGH